MVKVNAKEMIEKMQRIRLRQICIVGINPEDSRLIDLNEWPGNVYAIEASCIERGKAVVLRNNLKETVWERICNERIKYKRGKKVERMEDAKRI